MATDYKTIRVVHDAVKRCDVNLLTTYLNGGGSVESYDDGR